MEPFDDYFIFIYATVNIVPSRQLHSKEDRSQYKNRAVIGGKRCDADQVNERHERRSCGVGGGVKQLADKQQAWGS